MLNTGYKPNRNARIAESQLPHTPATGPRGARANVAQPGVGSRSFISSVLLMCRCLEPTNFETAVHLAISLQHVHTRESVAFPAGLAGLIFVEIRDRLGRIDYRRPPYAEGCIHFPPADSPLRGGYDLSEECPVAYLTEYLTKRTWCRVSFCTRYLPLRSALNFPVGCISSCPKWIGGVSSQRRMEMLRLWLSLDRLLFPIEACQNGTRF